MSVHNYIQTNLLYKLRTTAENSDNVESANTLASDGLLYGSKTRVTS